MQGAGGFERVVALNEAAKQLIARSFSVNLLAMDALVQSKQAGARLPGFDEVSAQMRRWSRELHEQLEQLGGLSRSVVERTSTLSKESHLLRLLGQAARLSGRVDATERYEALSVVLASRERELTQLWRRVDDLLGDLDQLSMMAVVLSRSAMIEAAGADTAHFAQLTSVSKSFYQNAEAAVEVLRALLLTMRRVVGT